MVTQAIARTIIMRCACWVLPTGLAHRPRGHDDDGDDVNPLPRGAALRISWSTPYISTDETFCPRGPNLDSKLQRRALDNPVGRLAPSAVSSTSGHGDGYDVSRSVDESPASCTLGPGHPRHPRHPKCGIHLLEVCPQGGFPNYHTGHCSLEIARFAHGLGSRTRDRLRRSHCEPKPDVLSSPSTPFFIDTFLTLVRDGQNSLHTLDGLLTAGLLLCARNSVYRVPGHQFFHL